LESHVLDGAVLQLEIEGDAVAAKGVVALRRPVGAFDLLEIARLAVGPAPPLGRAL